MTKSTRNNCCPKCGAEAFTMFHDEVYGNWYCNSATCNWVGPCSTLVTNPNYCDNYVKKHEHSKVGI